ncbi:DNA polymerase III subunit gamma/tau [Thiomicrospira microaerophila]|uniref:DNA polymerase III subunit gamma/tau n=1 Tax=Thiomicrospira microaerophila TaxID=406020 RepID=UPI00200D7C83|nr:DNA polymerase III subunit gamma/tau [Thiomicrospira microaerophila]UQB42785.1 DNA polymerase III subunit gamma/tau [Thiomicrospira microaerophila]
MSYTVLARKWRPKNFSELVGQTHVMQALSNALDSQRLHHAYLFTGTRGVGKTTIARIFSKALNCEQGVSSTPCGVCSVCQSINEGRFVDLIEIDAASRTKVEDTREILDNVQYAPSQGRYKVYLIDEVHMLSKSSFNALLKTLEEPPEHVKFLLATTDPHKLPITVLSRCLQFNLLRLTSVQIQQHLAMILQQEGIKFESAALAVIAKSADGSARDALSLLDQAIAYCGGELKYEAVEAMLGLVDQAIMLALLVALSEKSADQIKQVLKTLSSMGADYSALLNQLLEALHQISQQQILGEILDETALNQEVLVDLAQRLTPDQVQLYYQIALLARQDITLAPDIRIGFEMMLLRMLAFNPISTPGINQAVATEPEPESSTPAKPIATLLQQAQNKTAHSMKSAVSAEPSEGGSSQNTLNQVKVDQADTQENGVVDLSFFPDLKARLDEAKPAQASDIDERLIPSSELEIHAFESPVQPERPLEMASIPAAPPQAVMPELPVILDQPQPIEVWAELIESVHPEGMALELARRCILMNYNNQAWWLSVAPQYLTAKSEVAQTRLLEAAQDQFGSEFKIHYVDYSGDYYTLDDLQKDQQAQHQQNAVSAIKQDTNTQLIQSILGMQLLEKTIQPI